MWNSSLSSLPWYVSRVWGMREMKVRWLHMSRFNETRQNVATQAVMGLTLEARGGRHTNGKVGGKE